MNTLASGYKSNFNRLYTLGIRWGGWGVLAGSLIFPLSAAAQAPPNNVEATTAPVNKPAGVAYDAAGNLYIAALNDHVIRKVVGGVIVTLAGTGAPGFSGDGAAAAAAQFNLPVAVSVDASGNVYVADANNHRIRRIAGTIITTVAGNGEETFSGDNGPAIAAGLDTPNGVAADTLTPGRFYIGDTHNQRIRAVDATGTITTLAGTGAKTFSGDGAATTSALARPRGLAVAANGTIYLADSDNNRIRTIAGGTVATVAGTGDESFSGDTGLAINAALDTPRAAAVSLTGSIALTDTNNQRIRSVALNGATSTVAGIAPAVTESLLLAGPTSAVYGSGALTATFANGSQTAAGSLTLVEAGSPITTASLTANTATLSLATLPPGMHTLAATYPGDTVNAPIASGVYLVNVTQGPLIASASPIQVLYGQPIPTPTGTLTGVLPPDTANVTAVFSTPATQGSPVGAIPITVTLAGSAAPKYTVALAANSGSVVISQAGATTNLTTSNLIASLTAPITLTATVKSLTTGTPTGSVHFFNGSSQLASVALSAGIATLTTSALPIGSSTITSQYTGDANFTASTSNSVSEVVGYGDFTLTPATVTTPAIVPGKSTSFNFTVTPVSAPFSLPILFTASGLPPGVTATFNPTTITPGSSPANSAMTIQTSPSSAALRRHRLLNSATLALAFLLLPFSTKLRQRTDTLSPFRLTLLFFLSLGAVTLVTGCGTGSGFFGQPQQTYTIQVLATATTPTGATIQHTASVMLTVQ